MEQINVFEALFGKQGEVLVESLDSNLKFCTGIFKNGMFEKRIHTIGEFVRQVNNTEIAYLNQTCQPSFKMILPKIPVGMLHALRKFYAYVATVVKSEVAAQIFWDTVEKEYVLHVPVQQVTGSTVKYDRKTGMFVDARYVCVCNSHSHNTFGAFFSGVDNASEIDTCTYLVIGNVTSPAQTYAVRAGCNGSHSALTLQDLFDYSDETYYEIHETEMIKITEYKYVPPVYPTRVGTGVGASGAVRPYYYQNRMYNPSNQVPVPQRTAANLEEYYDMYYDQMYDPADFLEDPLYPSTNRPITTNKANENYNLSDNVYHNELNTFATAYNLFAQAITEDPNAADLGYTFVYDFVQLTEGLGYVSLDMMKTFFDNYYVYLKPEDIESLVQYISQTL